MYNTRIKTVFMKYSSALCSSLPSINLLCTLPCISIAQQTVRKGKKNTPNLHLPRSKQRKLFPAWKQQPSLPYCSSLCWEKRKQEQMEERAESQQGRGAARGGGSGCAPFSAWKCIPAKGTVLLYNVLCCGGATAPSLCEKRYSIYSQGISSAS